MAADAEPSPELLRVRQWRTARFEALGYDTLRSALLADSPVDWHDVARYLAAGCSLEDAVVDAELLAAP